MALANYTGHDYDAVLGVYFAQARVYDAGDRRFGSRDPVKGEVMHPETIPQYVYCRDNPTKYTDPWGCVSYDRLNVIGFALAIGSMTHTAALAAVLLTGQNFWLLGHQLAQVFAYKWLFQNYGFRYVELEHYFTNSASSERADIVAAKEDFVTMFEVKHAIFPFDEPYWNQRDKLLGAQRQLNKYFTLLACEMNTVGLDYELIKVNLVGTITYELFKFGDARVLINLTHRPWGVIDYTFSAYGLKKGSLSRKPIAATPKDVVEGYRMYEYQRQQEVYAFLSGISPETVLVVTLGVLTAGAIVGVAFTVVGPSIAAWVATASETVSIAVAGAGSYLAYQAGQAIQELVSAPPPLLTRLAG